MAHDGSVVFRRRKYVVLVVIGFVVVGVVCGFVLDFGREREPEYGGKRLSEWVEFYKAPPPLNALRQCEEADEAIRHVGTNAIPYLVEWIGYETPPWKARLFALGNPILRNLNSTWQLTDRRKRYRAHWAAVALRPLASQANWAVPELSRLLNDRSSVAAARALAVLGNPGCEAMVTGLTNPNPELRALTAILIRSEGTNAVPALVGLLSDSDLNMSNAAATCLREIDPQALERARR